MENIVKKGMGIKRIFFLNILILSSFGAYADFGGKMKNELGKEFTSLTGVYIIGGLVVAGLIIYLISNYVFKEKEEKLPDEAFQHSQHNHLRHKLRHSQPKDGKK
jgi:hypothetical protein